MNYGVFAIPVPETRRHPPALLKCGAANHTVRRVPTLPTAVAAVVGHAASPLAATHIHVDNGHSAGSYAAGTAGTPAYRPATRARTPSRRYGHRGWPLVHAVEKGREHTCEHPMRHARHARGRRRVRAPRAVRRWLMPRHSRADGGCGSTVVW